MGRNREAGFGHRKTERYSVHGWTASISLRLTYRIDRYWAVPNGHRVTLDRYWAHIETDIGHRGIEILRQVYWAHDTFWVGQQVYIIAPHLAPR